MHEVGIRHIGWWTGTIGFAAAWQIIPKGQSFITQAVLSLTPTAEDAEMRSNE
jgi:hypothetical protein